MIDHVALLPAYCAAGTAVLAFLCDLLAPRRLGPLLAVTLLGALATGLVCWLVYRGGERVTFCALEGFCSYRWDSSAALVGVVVASATMIVLGLSLPALSVPALRSPETSPETSVEAGQSLPAGEYCFLLACAMTGGVVLGASRDLITLVIALETLTLPLYVLVGLRRREVASAEAAVTFFVVSVVSTAVTLLGAALLYGATGTVHFSALPAALRAPDVPLVDAALVLVLVGLAFKVAAVPFHAWAPSTYDGAPLPVAAYLSTASKLGGVISLLYVAVGALGSRLDVVGPLLAVVAVLTMTVGNLVALRQRRMVRLLAWSSVAQAGYILAPLGALALTPSAVDVVVPAVLAYTVFYIVLELTAFGCVVALRGTSDGGMMTDYAGAARARPWVSVAFVLAMAGLAGLPPGLAGLFAKVVVVRSLLDANAIWLAVAVALNAVVGLAYYVRAAAALFASPDPARPSTWPRVHVAVGLTLAVVTVVGLVVGLAPQLVLNAVALR